MKLSVLPNSLSKTEPKWTRPINWIRPYEARTIRGFNISHNDVLTDDSLITFIRRALDAGDGRATTSADPGMAP